MNRIESHSTTVEEPILTIPPADAARLRCDCLNLAQRQYLEGGIRSKLPLEIAQDFLAFVMPETDSGNDPQPTKCAAATDRSEEPTRPGRLSTSQAQTGTGPFVHPFVVQNKKLRQELDQVLQRLKTRMGLPTNEIYPNVTRQSRNRQLALEAIEEAIMRLGMDLKDLKDEGFDGAGPSPYPNSYDAKSATIDPTADGLTL